MCVYVILVINGLASNVSFTIDARCPPVAPVLRSTRDVNVLSMIE